jgi:multisubunit Na+/H+ antiporter MnhG subunit
MQQIEHHTILVTKQHTIFLINQLILMELVHLIFLLIILPINQHIMASITVEMELNKKEETLWI